MIDWPPDPNLYPPYLRSAIRSGMGIGAGQDYRAWRSLRRLPIRSTATVVHGIRVSRNFELVDPGSTAYFFLLERDPAVQDIRERWPILDLGRTLQLAHKFDIPHPCRRDVPEPLTCDFLITEKRIETTYKAVNLIHSEDNLDARERILMKIRQTWCAERGIAWTFVDSSVLSRTVLQGLRFIRAWYLHRYTPNPAIYQPFSELFLKTYTPNILLKELVDATGRYLGLSSETRLDTFRYCAWADKIPVSLTHRISSSLPLVLR
jgi:hypothetical protein